LEKRPVGREREKREIRLDRKQVRKKERKKERKMGKDGTNADIEESKGLLSEAKQNHNYDDLVSRATTAPAAIPRRQGSEGDDGKRVCRNCHDDEGDDFIAPCLCAGSIRWVHRHCLDEWRSVSKNPDSFTKCDVSGDVIYVY